MRRERRKAKASLSFEGPIDVAGFDEATPAGERARSLALRLIAAHRGMVEANHVHRDGTSVFSGELSAVVAETLADCRSEADVAARVMYLVSALAMIADNAAGVAALEMSIAHGVEFSPADVLQVLERAVEKEVSDG